MTSLGFLIRGKKNNYYRAGEVKVGEMKIDEMGGRRQGVSALLSLSY